MNKEDVYNLVDGKGNLIRMRDGRPFGYTTHQLAVIGRRVLAKELGMALSIV